mgnify:FL=1
MSLLLYIGLQAVLMESRKHPASGRKHANTATHKKPLTCANANTQARDKPQN